MLRLNKCDHDGPLFLLAGGGDIKMGCTAPQHCTELDVLGLAKHVHHCPSFRGERGGKGGGIGPSLVCIQTGISRETPLEEAHGIVS